MKSSAGFVNTIYLLSLMCIVACSKNSISPDTSISITFNRFEVVNTSNGDLIPQVGEKVQIKVWINTSSTSLLDYGAEQVDNQYTLEGIASGKANAENATASLQSMTYTISIKSDAIPNSILSQKINIYYGSEAKLTGFVSFSLTLNENSNSSSEVVVWKSIASGYYHNLALKSDGTLWAWGYNEYGQIGDGTTTDVHSPKQIGSGYLSIATGYGHSLALKTDGSLWAWGLNDVGQLGDGSQTNSYLPKQIGTGIKSIAAGGGHTLVLRDDGTLWTWGKNEKGELGDGTTNNSFLPKQIGTDTYISIVAGLEHSMALKANGKLYAWGLNEYGQLGDGSQIDRHIPTEILSDVKSVAAGYQHCFAVKNDGTLWAWGDNSYNQLGIDPTANDLQLSQARQIDSDCLGVVAGESHTIMLKNDGTLWAWGRRDLGQIGDGEINGTNQKTHKQIGSGYACSIAGAHHNLAIKLDGTLWVWGWNERYGELGDGTMIKRPSPIKIE